MTFSADDFLKALDQHDFNFEKGAVVTGKVASHLDDGAYIDIGGKAAAFLPAREASVDSSVPLEEAVPIDSERDFLIVRDQDANGQVILSIRKLEIKEVWSQLEQREANKDILDVTVTGTNKGGVTADVEGLRGFVPRSHLVNPPEDLTTLVGQTISVAFLEVNEENNKLVLSNRNAARTTVMGQLNPGQLVDGKVGAIKPFGVFVDFDGARGLLHVKQISKSFVSSIGDVFEVGQAVKAVVLNLDEERGRISLSTKVLEKYPGEIMKEPEKLMAEAAERAADPGKLLAEQDG
ncbi:30S ribosomal protein S1 [Leptolyngbya cf. ectocarpi LEGE 11479]|uniref:30S ribosomal protein S1 n=1 Tax=Leptolyngbya cf. ectocarpi LEGE 11479 TaxID=1828722 RepID=A0A928ZXE4_LEPEC|nr:S1 RNA-binding domain-containing protein [Leptolyngbya ectocarpi]MBE9069211.1 30S ribosomal protein S1 [Leptolyngbya cf. ectocarpi LEGE 11479]